MELRNPLRVLPVRPLLRRAAIAVLVCIASAMPGVSAKRSSGDPGRVGASRSLGELTDQLEASRSTYHFTWIPDRWDAEDRVAVSKFLSDNAAPIQDLREALRTAHTLGENPLLDLRVARTACNVMVASAVHMRDEDGEASAAVLLEIFRAISLLPDEGHGCCSSPFVSVLLSMVQPGVQECGGIEGLDALTPVLNALRQRIQDEYDDALATRSHELMESFFLRGIVRLELMTTAIEAWEFEQGNRRLPTTLEELPTWCARTSARSGPLVFEWRLEGNSLSVCWSLPQRDPVWDSIALERSSVR